MSRWRSDPDAAADQLIARSLDAMTLSGRILVANGTGTLAGRLTGQLTGSGTVSQWHRRTDGTTQAAPWPPSGPFDIALVRLPKSREEQVMTVHAVLSVLAPDGKLILYGGNDEGIRSAASLLADVTGSVDTLAVRGHGRVLSARRPETSRLRVPLAAWRTTTALNISGLTREWVGYPGVFSAGHVDAGTRLLLRELPLRAGMSVLDYGCGSGVIGAAVLAHAPGSSLDMLDNDAVAIEAARENVPAARSVLGAGMSAVGARKYEAILSNPPLHRGIAEDPGLVQALVREGPGYLASGGVLQMVVQRRVPLEALLRQHFARVTIALDEEGYRVWRATAR
jgi:16S rRNA (guanine1207-N2)-methyltransferase